MVAALVAPLAGARIEIVRPAPDSAQSLVAPLAGARIEIGYINTLGTPKKSPPSRGRELKSPGVLLLQLHQRRPPRGGAN